MEGTGQYASRRLPGRLIRGRELRLVSWQSQLPPHPRRVPHSAHLGVKAVGFAQVAFACGVRREPSTLLEDRGQEAARTRLFDESFGRVKVGLRSCNVSS